MPDYNFIMDSRLRPEQLHVVNQLGRLAAGQGLILYLAGASARDLILGLGARRELSFVVEGNVKKILRPLSSRAQRSDAGRSSQAPSAPGNGDLKVTSVDHDLKLNRAHVIFEGGVGAEIAMSRNEVYGSAGKPPALSPGSIFDDLRRRDFSIDAMAISLHPNSRGLLLDPTNGAADIERRELRALHSRSFFDDPVRIYRLLRLGLRLDFKPDEKTERWLGAALEERAWEHVSEEQQGRELHAILGEESSGKLLKLLRERELLGGLDRKLASARVEFDRFDRIRNAVRTANASDQDAVVLNFHALVAKLPGAEQERLARKILKDSKLAKSALSLERDAGQLARALVSPKVAKPSQVYALLASASPSQVFFLLVHDTRSAVQNRIKAFFTKYAAVRASLPRAELRSLGLPPGPKFEKVMDQIFLDEIDGKIKSPQHMTKLLMDYAGIKVAPAPPPPVQGKSPGGKSAAARSQGTKAPTTIAATPERDKPSAAAGSSKAGTTLDAAPRKSKMAGKPETGAAPVQEQKPSPAGTSPKGIKVVDATQPAKVSRGKPPTIVAPRNQPPAKAPKPGSLGSKQSSTTMKVSSAATPRAQAKGKPAGASAPTRKPAKKKHG